MYFFTLFVCMVLVSHNQAFGILMPETIALPVQKQFERKDFAIIDTFMPGADTSTPQGQFEIVVNSKNYVAVEQLLHNLSVDVNKPIDVSWPFNKDGIWMRNSHMIPPLYSVVGRCGDTKMLKVLLTSDRLIVNLGFREEQRFGENLVAIDGLTALHLAVTEHCTDSLGLLLADKRADVNACAWISWRSCGQEQGVGGITPLVLAVLGRDWDSVSVLLDYVDIPHISKVLDVLKHIERRVPEKICDAAWGWRSIRERIKHFEALLDKKFPDMMKRA